MEESTVVTPEQGQDESALSFDSNGEMQFTEKGLEGFKELLKEGVKSDQRPVEEEANEEPEEEPAPEKEPEKKEPAPADPPKKKLKVDGQEIEVTEDELIAKAQQGEDYTRKMQRLAEERNALAPYEALIAQLKTDPNLSQHIAKYWQPKPEAEPAKPKFDDPIDQLKWETKQEVLADFRKEMQGVIAPLQQNQANSLRQQEMERAKAQFQADPDYHAVSTAIMGQVMALPGASELVEALRIPRAPGQPPDLSRVRNSLAKNAFLQLDQDMVSYAEAFQLHKQAIATGKKPVPDKPIEKSIESKRTERAPILESSNSAPSDDSIKSQKVKIDKAKARALREGSVDALQNLLETGGFLDHLK
jgi:hypothetical protein